MMANKEVFLDSAFVIALINTQDEHHELARTAESRLPFGTRFVLTRAVCLEIGNALTSRRFRRHAVRILTSIERDPQFLILPWDQRTYTAGLDLFRNRPDKEWSLTDCMSFVVMRERGITEALTTDHHFRQAGFLPLLRPSPN
jgi:predicted nucleic acid-binding protein